MSPVPFPGPLTHNLSGYCMLDYMLSYSAVQSSVHNRTFIFFRFPTKYHLQLRRRSMNKLPLRFHYITAHLFPF